MTTYDVNGLVEALEALLLHDEGVHVILKVAVVEGQPQTVEAEGRQELAVLVREEVVEVLVEEEVVLLLSEDLKKSCSNLTFASREAADEVLHHHPASEGGLLASKLEVL